MGMASAAPEGVLARLETMSVGFWLTTFTFPLTLFHLIGLVVSLLSTYFANVIIFIGLVVTDAETEMGSAPAEMDSAGS